MTALEGSETMPRMVPEVFWADIGARKNVAIQKPRMKHLLEDLMGSRLHTADRVSKSCCLALSAFVGKHTPDCPAIIGITVAVGRLPPVLDQHEVAGQLV